MKKKIGIQGVKGSFHHIAAAEYFGEDIVLNEFLSFEDMILCLSEDKIDYALMAIENSTAGSIIPNYALIDEYNMNIVGEHYLEISHNFMALKGQILNDINEVHSHPMALLQCREFLKENPSIKLIEEASETHYSLNQFLLFDNLNSGFDVYNVNFTKHSYFI